VVATFCFLTQYEAVAFDPAGIDVYDACKQPMEAIQRYTRAPATSTITVDAAGRATAGVCPTVPLCINDVKVAAFVQRPVIRMHASSTNDDLSLLVRCSESVKVRLLMGSVISAGETKYLSVELSIQSESSFNLFKRCMDQWAELHFGECS